MTLRWVKPTARDLDHVIVVLNLEHAPKTPTDGTLMYSGLGDSAVLRLRSGRSGYVAVFAYDQSDNVSKPARKRVSAASPVALLPLKGAVVDAAPHLTWRAKKDSAYYNVQIFRSGSARAHRLAVARRRTTCRRASSLPGRTSGSCGRRSRAAAPHPSSPT